MMKHFHVLPLIFLPFIAADVASLNFESFASGLASPRKLTFSNDGTFLYIAEAGVGGVEPCFNGVCYGTSGRVTRVRVSDQSKSVALSGLFSLSSGGASATNPTGPAEVLFNSKGDLYVSLGYGIPPSPAEFAGQGATLAASQGSSVLKKISTNGVARIVDLATAEFTNNFDQGGINSNIFSAILNPMDSSSIVVVDAGANAVFGVNLNTGSITKQYVFPKVNRPCLPPGGMCPSVASSSGPAFCCGIDPAVTTYATESVPTQVVARPNFPAELYVSELTGAPWTSDFASVHKLDALSLQITERNFVSGFHSIIGLAFDGPMRMYVLEQNYFGMASFSGTNRLTRVDLSGKTKTIIPTNGLVRSSSIAIRNGWLYASNSSLSNPGYVPAGGIVRVNLQTTTSGCPCPESTPCIHSVAGNCYAAVTGTNTCPQGTSDTCGWLAQAPVITCPCSGATPCRYLATSYCAPKYFGVCWPPTVSC